MRRYENSPFPDYPPSLPVTAIMLTAQEHLGGQWMPATTMDMDRFLAGLPGLSIAATNAIISISQRLGGNDYPVDEGLTDQMSTIVESAPVKKPAATATLPLPIDLGAVLDIQFGESSRLDPIADAFTEHFSSWAPTDGLVAEFESMLPHWHAAFEVVGERLEWLATNWHRQLIADPLPDNPANVREVTGADLLPMQQTAKWFHGAGQLATETYGVYRQQHGMEIKRIENPRPNESLWDVDGNTGEGGSGGSTGAKGGSTDGWSGTEGGNTVVIYDPATPKGERDGGAEAPEPYYTQEGRLVAPGRALAPPTSADTAALTRPPAPDYGPRYDEDGRLIVVPGAAIPSPLRRPDSESADAPDLERPDIPGGDTPTATDGGTVPPGGEGQPNPGTGEPGNSERPDMSGGAGDGEQTGPAAGPDGGPSGGSAPEPVTGGGDSGIPPDGGGPTRTGGGEEDDPRDERAESIERLRDHVPSPTYAERMREIDGAFGENVDPETVEGYVAAGGACYVYETDDGNLIKLPRKVSRSLPEGLEEDIVLTDYVEPLERMQGVAGYEQLVDYIPPSEDNRGAVVVERAKGKKYADLTHEERNEIPIDHFQGLARAYAEAPIHDILPDYDEANLVYDPDSGFTIIDYDSVERDPELGGRTPYESASYFLDEIMFDNNGRVTGEGARYIRAYQNEFGADGSAALSERLDVIVRHPLPGQADIQVPPLDHD
jgi:hypothetical protein